MEIVGARLDMVFDVVFGVLKQTFVDRGLFTPGLGVRRSLQGVPITKRSKIVKDDEVCRKYDVYWNV